MTEQPLLAIVHSNVGLMHASMAVYNAWCDRLPVLLLGATGPVDAARRRPWIDWIHTARDQGALVRGFVKWDDQPASVGGGVRVAPAREADRADVAQGPDVCLPRRDRAGREARRDAEAAGRDALPCAARRRAPRRSSSRSAAAMLRDAARPLLLMGRVSRGVEAWNTRVALAEALNARVLTDLKIGAAFPTDHPLHAAPPGVFLTPDAAAVVRDADVILSLDWVDLAGTLKQGFGNDDVAARVIQVSMDQVLHNGINMDHQGLPPTDLVLFCDPESAVDDLAREIGVQAPQVHACRASRRSRDVVADAARSASAWSPTRCSTRCEGDDACLIHLPLGWAGDMWHFRHPLDFVGSDGGGGIGAGPGLTVGGAIALKGTRAPARLDPRRRRLPHGRDRVLDARPTRASRCSPSCATTARSSTTKCIRSAWPRRAAGPSRTAGSASASTTRRPTSRMIARAQGLARHRSGDRRRQRFAQALRDAVDAVAQGKAVVVDVHVQPGYNPAMAAGMTRAHG